MISHDIQTWRIFRSYRPYDTVIIQWESQAWEELWSWQQSHGFGICNECQTWSRFYYICDIHTISFQMFEYKDKTGPWPKWISRPRTGRNFGILRRTLIMKQSCMPCVPRMKRLQNQQKQKRNSFQWRQSMYLEVCYCWTRCMRPLSLNHQKKRLNPS